MKRKYAHLPLKAYEVYEVDIDWRGRRNEYRYGIFVGRTAGQARATAVLDREVDNPWRGLRSRRVQGLEAELAIEKFEDRGKYWRDTRAFARRQAEADEFNACWPVGTPVEVVGCCEARHWPEGITITRTPAWASNQHTVLVSLEGYAGGFFMKYVRPLVEPIGAAPTPRTEGAES